MRQLPQPPPAAAEGDGLRHGLACVQSPETLQATQERGEGVKAVERSAACALEWGRWGVCAIKAECISWLVLPGICITF